jgi:hypothetical protein
VDDFAVRVSEIARKKPADVAVQETIHNRRVRIGRGIGVPVVKAMVDGPPQWTLL